MEYRYGAVRVGNQYFARVWVLNDDGTTTTVWRSDYGWTTRELAERYAESYLLPMRRPDCEYRLCRD